MFDLVKKSRVEGTLLRVLAACVEFARNETTSEVFGNCQTIAGNGYQRSTVQRNHLRLAEQAHPGRPFGEYGCKRI